MGVHIMELVHRHDITAIATLGNQGFCGHADHVATHSAAKLAVTLLRQRGRSTSLYSLDHKHEGDLHIVVSAERKLASLAMHTSQMNFNATTRQMADFWQTYVHYSPLLEAEVYRNLQ